MSGQKHLVATCWPWHRGTLMEHSASVSSLAFGSDARVLASVRKCMKSVLVTGAFRE